MTLDEIHNSREDKVGSRLEADIQIVKSLVGEGRPCDGSDIVDVRATAMVKPTRDFAVLEGQGSGMGGRDKRNRGNGKSC